MELHLKLQLILEIYAILVLTGLPIVLAISIYLYKKTDVIDRIDEWLDNVLGIGTQNEDASDRTEEESTETQRMEREQYEDEEIILPRFILRVGETYHCVRPKNTYRQNIESEWESDYPFIGEVTKERIFKARKKGICPLLFDRIPKFEIEIVPSSGPAFFDKDTDELLNETAIGNVRSRMIYKSLIQSDTDGKPLIYENPFKDIRTAWYTQKDGTFVSVLYRMEDDEAIANRITSAMNERFEKIDTDSEATFWYHQDIEDYVDAVAFMRTAEGSLLLGISKTWRDMMDVAETKLNVAMIEKPFAELTGTAAAKVELSKEEKSKFDVQIERVDTVTDSLPENTEEAEQEVIDTPEEVEVISNDSLSEEQFQVQHEELDTPEEEEDEEFEEQSSDMPDPDSFSEVDETPSEDTGEQDEESEDNENDEYYDPDTFTGKTNEITDKEF